MAIIKTLKGMPAPRFGKHCYFSEGAVIVGDVEMGDDCTVWFNAVVRGDVHFVKIGNRTNVQDNSCIHTLNGKAPCILGDDVTIGHCVTLHGCEVKDGELWGGVPAKFIKKVDPEQAQALNKTYARHYIEYSDWFREADSDPGNTQNVTRSEDYKPFP